MRKLQRNLHSPGPLELKELPPPSPASETGQRSAEISIPHIPGPARMPCPRSGRSHRGRSLGCLVSGSIRISSSLVPMQHGPLGTAPCGCCASCLGMGSKGHSAYGSEPALLRRTKKQYVFPSPTQGHQASPTPSSVGGEKSHTGHNSEMVAWSWGVGGPSGHQIRAHFLACGMLGVFPATGRDHRTTQASPPHPTRIHSLQERQV